MQLKITAFSLALIGLFHSGISIGSDTRSALDCYQQALRLNGINQSDAALLCANVGSHSDVVAVIGCYEQAFKIPQCTASSAVVLCNNVK
jgi:GNAT superfamily N-acetyltransferase